MMELLGKVVASNVSDGLQNLAITDEMGNTWNLKAPLEETFKLNYIYKFQCNKVIKERVSYTIESYLSIDNLDVAEQDEILRRFFPASPLTLQESIEIIESYLNQIQNEIIKKITEVILLEAKEKFYIYPAATRMHHAYVGGLAYHAIGMLRLAKSFLENYPYLKADYVYAGIILHDLGKIKELTGVEATEYTVDGQLLGHLVIGALEVNRVAIQLGFQNTKEVRSLLHMLISHHGQPQFGAAKRPMTPEAVTLWYIDTIDSKFRALGEELNKTEVDHFTDTIGVLDKVKMYKE